MVNPYKIVSYGNGLYGVEYKNYPKVGFPESWGTKAHATKYMANLLGMPFEEYVKVHRKVGGEKHENA